MSFIRELQWPRPFAGLRGLADHGLAREISSGITLAALVIPLNIGYAQVAGLPPVAGLYAAIVPLAIFSMLTSSRNVVGSPDASIAALTGAALLGFAAPEDPLRLQYALALSIMVGLLFFVFWFFRLAFLANFLSRAVLVGFITGLGLEVFTNQVRKIVGVHHGDGQGLEAVALQIQQSLETRGFLVELLALIKSVPYANLYTVAIGVAALLGVRLMKRYLPRVPGALVVLVVLTTLVAAFGLDEKGVAVLGDMPSGLPSFSVPDIPLSGYVHLIPAAFAIVAILMCEGLLLVRSYARKYHYKADGNQVFFAFGVANIAAGLTGSMVTGNSPSRSAAMEAAGARTQVPSLVAAATILVIMWFFTEPLAYLPTAALAGIVANAVISLIEVKELKELWDIRRAEFWIALVCLISVLGLGPLKAVIIAFLLSTIDVVRRASKPANAVMVHSGAEDHFVPVGPDHAPSEEGLLVYRFGAPLYFANAGLFEDEIESLVLNSPAPLKWFVLDAEAMTDMDVSGLEAFHDVMRLLSERNVCFAISRASPSMRVLLEHYHLVAQIGPERLYPTNRAALAAFRRERS